MKFLHLRGFEQSGKRAWITSWSSMLLIFGEFCLSILTRTTIQHAPIKTSTRELPFPVRNHLTSALFKTEKYSTTSSTITTEHLPNLHSISTKTLLFRIWLSPTRPIWSDYWVRVCAPLITAFPSRESFSTIIITTIPLIFGILKTRFRPNSLVRTLFSTMRSVCGFCIVRHFKFTCFLWFEKETGHKFIIRLGKK